MAWYKGGTNCCCGTEGCLISEDEFTRAPTTDTGWVTAGTVANVGDGVSWSGTANLAADDGSYASVTLAAGESSKYLDLSNFGLTIPSSALVTGIEVRYRRYASAGTAIRSNIGPLPSSYTYPYNNSKQDPTIYGFGWPTSEAEFATGSSVDSWYLILSPEEVNSSSFKIRIQTYNFSASSATAYIDIVQIKVHYATSPIGAGWSVQSGTWNMLNYSGNHCVTTEDTGAYLRFETAHPNSVAEHVVLVNFIHTPNLLYPGNFPEFYKHGDKLRIVLCDNTLFAEIELGFNQPTQYSADGCFIVRLFNGTTLLQESKPVGVREEMSKVSFWAGYSATTGVLWANFTMYEGYTPTGIFISEVVGTVSGNKVGIGTGDTVEGRIIFSDFHYYHHNYGTTITDCYEPGTEITQTCTFTKYLFFYHAGNPLTDIGCGWEIASGTWAGIEYGYYSTTGADTLETTSTNALVRCTQDQSSWNCIEYTDFGYQKLFIWLMWFDAEGDTARFYVDYDPVSGDAHWAEVTCGSWEEGYPGSVSIGKGGTTLETVDFGPRPPVNGVVAPFQVTLCTFVSEDGEDAVSVFVEGFWSNQLPDNNNYDIRLVSFTTVYGNKRVAFGTGATVNGKVNFRTGDYGIYGAANANACRDCYPVECYPCPAGDGPQGLNIEITGFLNKYSQYCGNCPDLDATYVIPHLWSGSTGGGCYGWKQWLFCAGPVEFGQLTYYLRIQWEIIEEVPGTSWTLAISIGLIPEGIYAPYPCWVYYKKTFTMSQRCDTLVDETIPYDSGPTFPGGFGSCFCDGVTSLTVKVTAY